MDDKSPVLSICTTCRDGREADYGTRGGARLAQHVAARMTDQTRSVMRVRGVHCMSQCKRPCVASLSAHERFTYVFGDLDPKDETHVEALFELISRYRTAQEGFLERKDRPKSLQASILGRLPALGSQSPLISDKEVVDP